MILTPLRTYVLPGDTLLGVSHALEMFGQREGEPAVTVWLNTRRADGLQWPAGWPMLRTDDDIMFHHVALEGARRLEQQALLGLSGDG